MDSAKNLTSISASRRREFDAAELEILWSRLIGIADECWRTISRTAFSLLVAESYDFGCEIFDGTGNSLAHSPRSMPLFNLALPLTVKSLLRHFPEGSLEDGDVLVTNDPWLGAGHLPDVALVTPIFVGNALVSFVGSIVNCTDIGGSRDYKTVREIYEEGLQIPPLKLYSRGKANTDLLAIIKQNVRQPEIVLGDIAAQHAANELAKRRLREFLIEYELAELSSLATTIQDRSEMAMRKAISAIPNGRYLYSIDFDSTDRVLTLPVAVCVSGDTVTVDWAGAPTQVEGPGVNCTLNYTTAHSAYALKCILNPTSPANAGCYRPIRVTAPAGSILNCKYPAPVQQRSMTGWYCGPAIHGALASAVPDQVQAFTGLPIWLRAFGSDENDQAFDDYFCCSGGQGASALRDGKSALLFPTSAANTSVELFEARVPILIERKELINASGGDGRRRGGMGSAVTLRKLEAEGATNIVFQPAGMLVEPPGLLGGSAGCRGRAFLEERGERTDLSRDGGLITLQRPTQGLILEASGGAGYGTPKDQ